MKCEDMRALAGAYLDGELGLTDGLAVEQHLESCTDCAASYRSSEALRDGIRAAPLYYTAAPGLRQRIERSVRQENRKSAAPRRLSWPQFARLPLHPSWALLAVPVVLLLAVVGAWSFARGQQAARPNSLVAQEVLASSMRSLMVGPLTDVQSSDRHTVKPWFAGKLDFSPTVQDYAAEGFPLAGGRLDYIAGRPVAALVYRHQQHIINLYTWPSPEERAAPLSATAYQGYNLFHWAQAGTTYWAVSDMDPAEMRQFVAKILKDAQ